MQKRPKLSLIEHFKNLPDPRVERTKDHELIDVRTLALCTLLCAGESCNDMEDFGQAKEDWFRTFLTLKHGIPSPATFNHVFAALDPVAFGEGFMAWTHSLRSAVAQEIVALDGKARRRALDADQNSKVIVSAWAQGNGLGLGQLKVDDKSNEITARPRLLRARELTGCIVTGAAMGTQKQIAQESKAADADYVMALKGNHETVHEEVKSFLAAAVTERSASGPPGAQLSAGAANLVTMETGEKDHGRLETRRYYQSAEVDWFENRAKWAGLQRVGRVEAVREVGGKKTVERRYYLTSLPLGVEPFARAGRGHWSVENQRHWVLDVQMREDLSRARTGYTAENLAPLRRLALNLLKREKTKKRGGHGKQLNASWDHAYLRRLLGAPD